MLLIQSSPFKSMQASEVLYFKYNRCRGTSHSSFVLHTCYNVTHDMRKRFTNL